MSACCWTRAPGTWSTGVEAAPPANSKSSSSASVVSVSCASAGNCSAVGTYVDTSGVEQGWLLDEASRTWSTGVEAELPSNAGSNPQVTLTSVSCGSAGNCSAVGTYVDRSGAVDGLLLDESSGTWSAGTEATLPPDAGSDSLGSVSCASPGNCSAVGHNDLSQGYFEDTVVLDESSGMWSHVGTSPPANAEPCGDGTSCVGDFPAGLYSVSCASPGNCSAVGTYLANSAVPGLLLDENSGTWSRGVEATLPANSQGPNPAALTAVSCGSAGNCAAVGDYYAGSGYTDLAGLLLDERSGTWSTGTEAELPSNAGSNPGVNLASVSCASAGNCAAVGDYTDSAGNTQGLLLNEIPGTDGTDRQRVDRHASERLAERDRQSQRRGFDGLRVDYGTTTAYGSSVPCAETVASGSSQVTVSAQISNLAPGTTYHVRVVATNAAGTGTGQDVTFTTTPGPPPPPPPPPPRGCGSTSDPDLATAFAALICQSVQREAQITTHVVTILQTLGNLPHAFQSQIGTTTIWVIPPSATLASRDERTLENEYDLIKEYLDSLTSGLQDKARKKIAEKILGGKILAVEAWKDIMDAANSDVEAGNHLADATVTLHDLATGSINVIGFTQVPGYDDLAAKDDIDKLTSLADALMKDAQGCFKTGENLVAVLVSEFGDAATQTADDRDAVQKAFDENLSLVPDSGLRSLRRCPAAQVCRLP